MIVVIPSLTVLKDRIKVNIVVGLVGTLVSVGLRSKLTISGRVGTVTLVSKTQGMVTV